MSEAVRNATEEYWRPAQPPRAAMTTAMTNEAICDTCGTEFALGARFCHVCGSERGHQSSQPTYHHAALSRMLDFDQIRDRLGLTSASLVLMVMGFGCILAAILTGIIYTANTVLDWQAVQIWRIEWMLAALVFFVAGILLKKSRASEND